MDCGGRNRYASRLHGAERPGADGSRAGSAFRARVCFPWPGGDLIKLPWFDGDGLCLFSKKLERGRFVWPQADSGTVSLTRAQLSMLLEGIDWQRPDRTWQPDMTV
jgi:transposase